MKKIIPADTAKEIARDTITEVAAVVKKTLGPGGNPIILEQLGQNPDGTPKSPLITKDGVTVAESITFTNPAKNTIAKSIISVAQNTVEDAGDGTSTSLVLAEAIYKEGYEFIKQGRNNIKLYEDLKDLSQEVINKINSISEPVEDPEDIFSVARISANGDEEIAGIVRDAIQAVGEDGHITLEDGNSRTTELKVIKGAMYKQGYRKFSPQGLLMVTDKGRDECVLEQDGVGILLYNGRIDDINELTTFMKRFFGIEEGVEIDFEKLNHPLLIIANDFSDEAKNFILQNRVQMQLPIAAIKTPSDGSPNSRTGILDDLAALTGGTVAAKGIIPLKTLSTEQLGMASRVVISAHETVFYGGAGEEEGVLARIDDLKKLIEESIIEYDKTNYRIRLGKLTNGIATVRVGGSSDLEIQEKKDRIEDALCAAKVALQDGIIPGGGSVLYKISEELSGDTDAEKILKKALKAPFEQLIHNIGLSPLEVMLKMPDSMEGYNVRTREYVPDMVADGIIDPSKATKSAIENAVSIAGLLLTTGGMVVNDDDSKETPNPFAALMGG
jgi:chaperonin GroEL